MRHKIRGDLSSWNSSVWEFGQLMKNISDDEDITLEVNSYGGDVFIGIDICNTLRSHKGPVTAIVTGIAASAASILLMGADKIQAYSNTQIMVHNAWTIIAGNAKELRKAADDLDSIGESVLASYTGRIDADQAKKLLEEETFLSAKKALDLGLIDEIIDNQEAEEAYSDVFKDQAQEFNDSLKTLKIASSIDPVAEQLDDLITKRIADYFKNNKGEPQKKPAEPRKPTQPPAAKTAASIKNIFLNL